MNILFIHEVDWLEKVVFDIHILAESLSLRGHRVYAVDYENTWKRRGVFDFGTLRTRQYDGVSRALEGSEVCLRRPGFIKIPCLSRVSAAATHYREIKRTVREENIDAIILYGVPTNGLQAMSAARKAGIPLIFRSIDVLNRLVPFSMLRPATRFIEKKVYSGADMVLALNPGLTEYVKKLGAGEEKIRLLLMPLDDGMFHPGIPSDDVRAKWGFTKDDRIILFMGTLFDFSGLDDILPLFYRVTEKIPSAKLLILGDGPQRSALETLISRYKLEDSVIITGFEPYEMMPRYINMADVCINTFRLTGATLDIFPGKTVQFLACGKPLVATPLPGMMDVLAGEGQGTVYAESPEDMISKIIALLDSPERRQKLGQAGLEYVRKYHSIDSIAGQLEELIQEAIENKRS